MARGANILLSGVFSVALVSCSQAADSKSPADQRGSKIPVYEIKMEAKDFSGMERNPYGKETHPATFVADSETYDGVRVRFRGDWARTWPKKPIKLFFTDEKPFRGQHCLNLNSSWRDPAFIREHLAYELYATCGVPASKSRMVRLQMNGQFLGLYVEVEQPDKPLLRRTNLKGAALFKTISHANQADERDLGREQTFRSHYSRETQKEEDLKDLQLFCHELARATNVLDFFTRHVDLENYINYLVATALTQNWDCFNKNHFLVYDVRNSRKWSVIPWDLDRTLGDHWHGMFDYAQLPAMLGTSRLPGTTGWNRLQDRFFSQPALRARFVARLDELLQKEFTTEKLFPVIDRLESEISAEAALDRKRWPSGNPDLHTGIAQLKDYISRRRAFLLSELISLRRT